MDDGELSRLEYRKPRDLLLKIVSEFLTRSTGRLSDLSKKIPDLHSKNSSYELLDVKCHLRLAEIAHSLLKLAPYDPQTMACKGLVRYMNEILPNSEWRQEQMRPALIMVLRRLDKTFTKISKKSAIKRSTDWEAAKRLLKGVYMTFTKHPYIVHLPHLKSLITVCQNIILGDLAFNLSDSSSTFSSWTLALSQAPPPGKLKLCNFCYSMFKHSIKTIFFSFFNYRLYLSCRTIDIASNDTIRRFSIVGNVMQRSLLISGEE